MGDWCRYFARHSCSLSLYFAVNAGLRYRATLDKLTQPTAIKLGH